MIVATLIFREEFGGMHRRRGIYFPKMSDAASRMHRFWVEHSLGKEMNVFPRRLLEWAAICRKLEFWVKAGWENPLKSGEENRGETIYLKKRRKDYFLLLFEEEGAMLTFGPWGALSRPPATQWTLKQPPRKETFNFSSLSVFFGRIFLFLLCVGDSTSSCSCTTMIACLLCKLKQIPVFICIFKCSAKIHPRGTCFMICVNALLPFQCFYIWNSLFRY